MNTFSVKIFNKSILSYFSHYIMVCNTNCVEEKEDNCYRLERITHSPEKMIDGPYSASIARKIVNNNKGKCDVFLFLKNNQVLGTISIMYKNGDDIEYKIRNIDAFIYNVHINAKSRGKGHAGRMINLLMKQLNDDNYEEVYLAVSQNNKSAIKAYIKVGFKIVDSRSFFRVMKINIPYKTL